MSLASSGSFNDRDSQSPLDSAKLPNLAEDWENEKHELGEETDALLDGIDQMASVKDIQTLENFQNYRLVTKQRISIMKHEVNRGRMKLKERREIIAITNEEMPDIIKTITCHTRIIMESSFLSDIIGNYDPWVQEKRVDIRERSVTGQKATREIFMTLSSSEELVEFENSWNLLWTPKHNGNDVTD